MSNQVTRRDILQGLAAIGGTSLLATGATSALAQAGKPAAWPTKPIRVVVPFNAGGATDIIARTIGEALARRVGQPVVIDNRAGAAGILGTDAVVKAPADGHTLLVSLSTSMLINQFLYTKLPYNPQKDIALVTQIAAAPVTLVVHPSVPANNLQELVALSKKEDLSFAVTATGSAPHLAGVELARATGARWEYVPYKGGVQSIQDTVAGQTQVLMNGMLATYPHVQSGKLKLLGLSKGTRMPLAANVPTIAEQGVPGFETGTWQGVVVPAKTPEAVVQRLHEALITAIRSPEVRARLTGQGAEVVTMNPAETARFLATERQRWQKVVQTAGLKLD